jgi:hypothetical protein
MEFARLMGIAMVTHNAWPANTHCCAHWCGRSNAWSDNRLPDNQQQKHGTSNAYEINF